MSLPCHWHVAIIIIIVVCFAVGWDKHSITITITTIIIIVVWFDAFVCATDDLQSLLLLMILMRPCAMA